METFDLQLQMSLLHPIYPKKNIIMSKTWTQQFEAKGKVCMAYSVVQNCHVMWFWKFLWMLVIELV